MEEVLEVRVLVEGVAAEEGHRREELHPHHREDEEHEEEDGRDVAHVWQVLDNRVHQRLQPVGVLEHPADLQHAERARERRRRAHVDVREGGEDDARVGAEDDEEVEVENKGVRNPNGRRGML